MSILPSPIAPLPPQLPSPIALNLPLP